MNNKRIISVILSLTLIFSASSCIESVNAAKSITTLKKELADNASKKQEAIREKAEKQQELNTAVDKKNELDIKLSALQEDIDLIDNVITEKEREIDEKSSQIEQLSEEIDESKDTLKERMKIMYENGTSSYLEIIFQAKGLSDLFTRIAVVQDIVKHDKNMIEEYVNSKTQIENAKLTVEKERDEQKEAKTILDEKKTDLKQMQSERDELINELKTEITKLEKFQEESEKYEEQARKELQEAIAAQEAQAKKAEKQSVKTDNSSGNGSAVKAQAAKAASGIYGWPSANSTRVTSEFSPRRKNPVSGVWKKHTGMDIGAAAGTDVLASRSGTVVTAKWNNGYGYYITINHGDGVATLYAHNSKLLVKAGDKVEKGQVIAKVGSTGNSTGPHIHFEVIVNGEPQNPRNYL